MDRITKTANEGYIFTQIADVPIEQRAWGRVIDTTQLELFHEVPIAKFEEWQKEIEKLNPIMYNLNEEKYDDAQS